MDTSETYIKMCKGAEEIQGSWVRDKLDFYIVGEYAELDYPGGENLKGYKQLVWLPRQDQLQEMVEHGLESGFIDWHRRPEYKYGKDYFHPFDSSRRFNSWEQLWLAFVMKEKYNKVWDGERWVNT